MTDKSEKQARHLKYAQQYLRGNLITILYDNTFVKMDQLQRAETFEQIPAFLEREQPTEQTIIDDMVLRAQAEGEKLSVTDARRALRHEMLNARGKRRKEVLQPLCCPLDATEQELAKADWRQCGTLFKDHGDLAQAGLKHFIWQVKRKSLGHKVVHHLMPVIVSPAQGTGKTRFVQQFIAPLMELATGPVLLSQLSDPRSADIFRYPVLFVDDMGNETKASEVAALKSVITAGHIRRRRPGSSDSIGIRQGATPIGTANHGIEHLIQDPTGHRRFLVLPFRNGEVSTGGDPKVWEVVNNTDYMLLWRSVDAFGPAPIVPHLETLIRHQACGQAPDPLRDWLRGVDVTSDTIERIRTKYGIRAHDLYETFVASTNSDMSEAKFGSEMQRRTRDSEVPFDPKARRGTGFFYKVRARLAPQT